MRVPCIETKLHNTITVIVPVGVVGQLLLVKQKHQQRFIYTSHLFTLQTQSVNSSQVILNTAKVMPKCVSRRCAEMAAGL